MPWYTDLDGTEKYNAFSKWLNENKGVEGRGYVDERSTDKENNKKSYSGLMQFWAWTYDLNNEVVPCTHLQWTWQGDKQKGIKASRNAHLAEAVLSYFKGMLSGKSPMATVFLQAVNTVPERTGVAFERAAVTAGNGGVNFEQLARELIGLRGEVNQKIQQLWDIYSEELDLAIIDESFEAVLIGETREGLNKLRAHQKVKLDGVRKGFVKKGGHRKGRFFLLQKAKDQQPLLLVSSGLGKEVSKEWKSTANTLCSGLNKNRVEGVYSQDQDLRFIYFGVKENAVFASVELFKAALKALGVQRDGVNMVSASVIESK